MEDLRLVNTKKEIENLDNSIVSLNSDNEKIRETLEGLKIKRQEISDFMHILPVFLGLGLSFVIFEPVDSIMILKLFGIALTSYCAYKTVICPIIIGSKETKANLQKCDNDMKIMDCEHEKKEKLSLLRTITKEVEEKNIVKQEEINQIELYNDVMSNYGGYISNESVKKRTLINRY